MFWHPLVAGNNCLNVLDRLLLLKLSQTCPTVKQSCWWTVKPHLSSLSPLHQMGMIAVLKSIKPQTFLIIFPLGVRWQLQFWHYLPIHSESILETFVGYVCELYLMIWCRNLHVYQNCLKVWVAQTSFDWEKNHFMIPMLINQCYIVLCILVFNSELECLDVATLWTLVLRGTLRDDILFFGFVSTCPPPEKHPQISKWTDLTI